MYSDSFFGNERICSDAFSGSFFSVSVSLHSTAQHSTAQHSTAQHSTAQHSTAQHSTAQHSTAQMQTAFARHSPGLFFQAESTDQITSHAHGMKHYGFVPGFFFMQATQPENDWTDHK
jgi:hypothetical protein